MADVSKTTNLDRFQKQFNEITKSGHEPKLEIKNGQVMLVKGRGKSWKSRVWSALKHPLSNRDMIKKENKAVVFALMHAADRDIASLYLKGKLAQEGVSNRMGAALVEKCLKTMGFKMSAEAAEKLSPEQVNAIIKFLTDQIGKHVDINTRDLEQMDVVEVLAQSNERALNKVKNDILEMVKPKNAPGPELWELSDTDIEDIFASDADILKEHKAEKLEELRKAKKAKPKKAAKKKPAPYAKLKKVLTPAIGKKNVGALTEKDLEKIHKVFKKSEYLAINEAKAILGARL